MLDFGGQWVGWNNGPNAGTIVIDLDLVDGWVAGHFFLLDSASDLVGTFGQISFRIGALPEALEIPVFPFHPDLGRRLTPVEFQEYFPEDAFPSMASVRLEAREDALVAHWTTNIGTFGEAVLHKGNDRETTSVLAVEGVSSWSDYRKYVHGLNHEDYVYRGQAGAWPLRTSFHRTSRSDLVPFIQRDMPTLLNQLSGRLKHLYDLNNPQMNASFWALAQHHGYPTPLLDWTYSPYVAAYFAYQNAPPLRKEGFVNVFVLEKQRWHQSGAVFHATHSYPSICLFEPISLENDRAIPQQSVMMASNVDDVEDFISFHENVDKRSYLSVIKLPIAERVHALSDLRKMGIGAGSLFPGIDGTCRDFKERYFPEY